MAKSPDNAADFLQAFVVVFHFMVGYSADLTMDRGAAERFVIDFFSDGSFYQMRAGKKDTSGFIDNQRFIAHDGKVSSACNAWSHNRGDLRDSHRRHHRVVTEYSAEMLFVRKNF